MLCHSESFFFLPYFSFTRGRQSATSCSQKQAFDTRKHLFFPFSKTQWRITWNLLTTWQLIPTASAARAKRISVAFFFSLSNQHRCCCEFTTINRCPASSRAACHRVPTTGHNTHSRRVFIKCATYDGTVHSQWQHDDSRATSYHCLAT